MMRHLDSVPAELAPIPAAAAAQAQAQAQQQQQQQQQPGGGTTLGDIVRNDIVGGTGLGGAGTGANGGGLDLETLANLLERSFVPPIPGSTLRQQGGPSSPRVGGGDVNNNTTSSSNKLWDIIKQGQGGQKNMAENDEGEKRDDDKAPPSVSQPNMVSSTYRGKRRA